MNRGAKRPAFDSTGPELRSKRVTDGPSLGMPLPGVDPQRTALSQQHVRALNTQFASWVQLQLQNHPDELWEDGAKDYLCHASNIMEKFKDVVDWLKANAAKSGGMSTTGLPTKQNNLVAVSDNNKPNPRADINNGFSQVGTSTSSPNSQSSGSLFSLQSSSSLFTSQNTSSFSPSQSTSSFSTSQSSGSLFGSQSSASLFGTQSSGSIFGLQSSGSIFGLQSSGSLFSSQSMPLFSSSQSSSIFSSSQAPAFPGSHISTPPKVETKGDIDEDDESEKPSSPSLKKIEEKGIIVVHEVKCKVFVKSDNPVDKGWKDIGVGQLSIKCKEGASKATKESNPTIVIRNDVGKILLNALIYPSLKMNIQKKTITSVFHTSGGSGNDASDSNKAVARTYSLRMRNEEETTKLATTIKEYTPVG